jgi:undecaprenyl-phosphate 4-deoxy-4-formamido-L-arabinose transferase
MADDSISVVVPVYNAEATLDPLVGRLERALAGRAVPYEIVLVNDGSRDASWDAIRRLAADRPRVRGIDLCRNYGQHNALLCGIREARFDVIVTLDDDLQHPPEELPRLLDVLGQGHDVVYGYPHKEQHGFLRDVASQVTKIALQKAMGAEVARRISALRAFRASLRRAFDSYRGPHVSIDVLLSWATTRFAAVAVRHEPRRVGRSNYTFRKLAAHAINMTTGFSTAPLQAVSLLGFASTLLGLLVLAFVVGRYLIEGGAVPGFPFLASIIALFAGVQLFSLGVMGEYVARMYSRLLDRPAYAVRDQVCQDTQEGRRACA